MIKKKLTILLVSMLIFMAIFTYGAIQYISPSKEGANSQSEFKKEDNLYENVWIENAENNKVKFFFNGESKVLDTKMSLGEKIENTIGDIEVKNGVIEKIVLKPEKIKGKLVEVNKTSLEIEVDQEVCQYPMASNFVVYRKGNQISSAALENLLVGYNNVEYILCNDEICAAIITEDIAVDNIRVILRTQDFKELLHDKVIISCNKEYTVKSGKTVNTYPAGKKITLKITNKLLKKGRAKFSSKEKGAKFTFTSFTRNGANPSYMGSIEISKQDGKLVVVNELPLEEYLYSVVPSEMPTSYGVEALKVQAVCARTYAYKQLLQNNYSQYGAHIDDSVASQVYNNSPADKKSIEAVDATKGQVLQGENEIISAYYFSTSWGCTADAADVWLGETRKEYLDGGLEVVEDSKETIKNDDFSKEEDFIEFMNNTKVKTYDSEFPWYRWSVTLEPKDIRTAIENNLKERFKVNPALIKVKNDNGEFESLPVESIGDVKNITVANRCKSGLINELIVEGSEKTIKIYSEYNIRLLLAPISATIKRHDKSELTNLSMLPSSFFYITKNDKGSFTIRGGGYGHGVGMSQNGAKAMAESGIDYLSILDHYYKGASVVNLYPADSE